MGPVADATGNNMPPSGLSSAPSGLSSAASRRSSGFCGLIQTAWLRENVVDDLAVDVGQPELATLETEGQTFMIDA